MKRVIVAHDAAPIRDAALRVVRETGYEAVGVGDGASVRVLLNVEPRPSALVVDVGLPGVLGYQLVKDIRGNSMPIKVVLIASVYSRTAYKRRPKNLYGADDYVEQHHIPDKLGPKLAKLLADAPPPARDVHIMWNDVSTPDKIDIENIREAGEQRLAFRYHSQQEAIRRARALARLIVSDVMLYADGSVEDGGHSHIERQIELDLQAAREVFALRVPKEIAGLKDFVSIAFEEFVAGRVKEDN